MGQCAMRENENDQKCLGIIAPSQACACECLTQGAKISMLFYQLEMVELSEDLNDAKVLLDGTGVIRKSTFEKYIKKLDEWLTIMEDAVCRKISQKVNG